MNYHAATVIIPQIAKLPGVLQTLAEEILLLRLEPIISAPDFLLGEEQLLAQWETTTPDAYREAVETTQNALGDQHDWAGRPLCRLASYRRLFACFFGAETPKRPAELGGEAILPLRLQNGADYRLCVTATAHYRLEPKRWEDYLAWRDADPRTVTEVENAIAPHCGRSNTRDEWIAETAKRTAAIPFREWNAKSHIPSILHSQIFDLKAIPDGIEVRPGVAEAINASRSLAIIDLLYNAGISAFQTAPAADYLRSQAKECAALASKQNLLGEFYKQVRIG